MNIFLFILFGLFNQAIAHSKFEMWIQKAPKLNNLELKKSIDINVLCKLYLRQQGLQEKLNKNQNQLKDDHLQKSLATAKMCIHYLNQKQLEDCML